MKRHTFSQDTIIGNVNPFNQERIWTTFAKTVSELGYKIRVIGGNFLTHDITCTEEEFNFILEYIGIDVKKPKTCSCPCHDEGVTMMHCFPCC